MVRIALGILFTLIFCRGGEAAEVRQAQVRGVVIEEGPQPLIFEEGPQPRGERSGNYYRLMESQMAATGKILPQNLKRGQTVEFTGLFLDELNPRMDEQVWQYIYPMSLSSLKVVTPKVDKPLDPECQKRLYDKFKDIEGLVSRGASQEP
jgi:hypothetical protein